MAIKPSRRTSAMVVIALIVMALSSLAIWLNPFQPAVPSSQDLMQRATGHQADLANRLRLADRVLRSLESEVNVRGASVSTIGSTEHRYFDAVALVAPGQPPVRLLGNLGQVPVLGATLTEKLALGDTVIFTAGKGGGSDERVMMARAGASGALLVGELAARYLWDFRAMGADEVAFCVRDGRSVALHCSSPTAMGAVQSQVPELSGLSGTVEWQSGAANWRGAVTGLELASPHGANGWKVMAMTSRATGKPQTTIASWFVLVGLVILGTAAAFAFLRQRDAKRAAPLKTQTSYEGNESPDALKSVKGEQLSRMLERQKHVIRALAEIDRASLSRANAARLVELVAGQLIECTGCEVLLVGVLDHNIDNCMTIVIATQSSAPVETERTTIGPSSEALMAITPDGLWLVDLHQFELLAPQIKLGARGAQVIPIYEEGKAIGIISLGFVSARFIGADESSNARALAGRLGAALTSAARTQALYASTHFDPTTALPNRLFLREYLAQQIKQARREQTRLALLFVNLDGFKRVNSIVGIQGGDQVLTEAAIRMRDSVREEDVVTRFEGDEFVVVLPNIAEAVDARRVADKLLRSAELPYLVDGKEHTLGCSIGISVFPEDAQTVDIMLRNAHSAMFSTREGSLGHYAFFDESVNRAAIDRTRLEQDLRRALSNVELNVVYQPQVNLASGRIEGAEALVRWRLPNGVMIPPLEFIGAAERVGLIGDIGEYVMRTACKQFRAWDDEGIAPDRIAINVSSLEIVRSDIVTRVENILRETGLRPMHLELEITEGTLLDAAGGGHEKLALLRERGVRIAVDDFGTGYSSLSYLQRLPIDVLKIDQSFVREIANNPDSGSIVRAILQVAQGLGKAVVAEGIETERQRELLTQWGCDTGQGYLWSRPLGAVDFENFCRDWRKMQQNQSVTAPA